MWYHKKMILWQIFPAEPSRSETNFCVSVDFEKVEVLLSIHVSLLEKSGSSCLVYLSGPGLLIVSKIAPAHYM
ncbi:unnamed protein product [Amoebophrya sp. A120]|nr:unnamed protein product [Amoebophrya sp. A120]|eukprot:GSA120T00006954001.1